MNGELTNFAEIAALRNVDGRWYTFEYSTNFLQVFEDLQWKTLAKPTVAAVHHPNVVTANGMIYVLGQWSPEQFSLSAELPAANGPQVAYRPSQ